MLLVRVLHRKGAPCGAHGGFCAIVPGLEAEQGALSVTEVMGRSGLGPTDRNGSRIHCDKWMCGRKVGPLIDPERDSHVQRHRKGEEVESGIRMM